MTFLNPVIGVTTKSTIPISYTVNTGSGNAGYNYATSHTHSSIGLGSTSTDRTSLYCFAWGTNQQLNSATIGGVSATILAQNSSGNRAAIFMCDTSSLGSSADVVLSYAGLVEVSSGVMYALFNADTSAFDTSVATGSSSTSTTINIAANSIVFASGMASSSSAFPTWNTWVGVDEDHEQNSGTNYIGGVGSSREYSAAVTAQPISVNVTSTSSSVLIVANIGSA